MLQNVGRQALTPKKYFLPHISVLTEDVVVWAGYYRQHSLYILHFKSGSLNSLMC